jgi:CBS domain-containing protein
VAAWIAQIGLGAQPAFALPAYEVRSLLELPLYVGLGLLASLVSLTYVRLLRFSQQCFKGQVAGTEWLARVPRSLHPVLGGICLGLVALWLPQILGVGYETVESMLQDVQFPLHLVLALLVIKLLMTAISFGSGFVGGVFAPALFLGASLGSAYGKVLAIVLPNASAYLASSPAYAMVGMAAVLAGSVRAPLTAILLLFELTRDYRIVLPLMAAVGLSIWLVEYLHPQVVIDNTPDPKPAIEPVEPAVLPPVKVIEAMQPISLQLPETETLADAGHTLLAQRRHSALVIDANQQLIGILTLRDVHRLMSRTKTDDELDKLMQQPIRELCSTELVFAYEDELLSDAVDRLSARGLHQLPVMTRDDPPQVIGLLSQEDIDLANSLARTREALQRRFGKEEG